MDGLTSGPLPANFTETSTNRNMKLSPSQAQELLLYFSFHMHFGRVVLLQFVSVCNESVSFPACAAHLEHSQKTMLEGTFLPN